jgi:hypothetical protein
VIVSLAAFAFAFACEQTNGDPTPPTVVTAPTTTSTAPPTPPSVDAGADADAGPDCTGFADPTTDAGCHAKCTSGPCNANGCFGTYYCDLGALKCVPKPAGCP